MVNVVFSLNTKSESSFFKNEKYSIWLDELDKLDRISYALIQFNYSLKQAREAF